MWWSHVMITCDFVITSTRNIHMWCSHVIWPHVMFPCDLPMWFTACVIHMLFRCNYIVRPCDVVPDENVGLSGEPTNDINVKGDPVGTRSRLSGLTQQQHPTQRRSDAHKSQRSLRWVVVSVELPKVWLFVGWTSHLCLQTPIVRVVLFVIIHYRSTIACGNGLKRM